MSVHDLEGRYRRLLRFYPRQYRAARGDEIVDTYMELAAPDRAKPSLADAADIVKAGMRQRLRGSPNGFDEGLRIAAIVAMCGVVVMAADTSVGGMIRHGSMDSTLGLNVYAPIAVLLQTLWLAVAISALFLPGRFTRATVGVVLAATLVVTFLPLFTNALTPDPLWLIAQLMCGAFALAWPDNPPRWIRALPLVAVVATLAATAGATLLPWFLEQAIHTGTIPAAFFITVGAGLMLRAIAKHHAAGMWWAVALLAAPASFVAWRPVLNVVTVNSQASGPVLLLVLTFGLLGFGIAIPALSYATASRKQQVS